MPYVDADGHNAGQTSRESDDVYSATHLVGEDQTLAVKNC